MALPAPEPLTVLAGAQDGVATLAQLALVGVTASRARAQVAAGRWTRYPPLAVVLYNGPLEDLHPGRTPPRTRTARSAVDAASWSWNPRTAVGVLAAVVQQRLVRLT